LRATAAVAIEPVPLRGSEGGAAAAVVGEVDVGAVVLLPAPVVTVAWRNVVDDVLANRVGVWLLLWEPLKITTRPMITNAPMAPAMATAFTFAARSGSVA
jgi:hypothetical protein